MRTPATPRRIMAQGFVVQLFNPKVAIFFLAYFPQFLDPHAPVLPQTLLLGALYVAIAACSDLAYVLLVVADRRPPQAQRIGAPPRGARQRADVHRPRRLAALSGERSAPATR